MERRAFVLLSGGLDSTTNLFKAIYDYAPKEIPFYGDAGVVQRYIVDKLNQPNQHETWWVEAVSVNYGQRHQKEMQYAAKTCALMGIKHTILDVGDLLKGKSVMLSSDSKGTVEVPDIAYSDIKGVSPTYVPFRNGLLLSAITAYAQKWVNEQIQDEVKILKAANTSLGDSGNANRIATESARDIAGVYFGAHSEDAANWAYPDCTPEFIGAMANAIHVGSYYAIRLHTPLEWLNKAEIIELGTKMDVPYDLTWSCYKGEDLHCGKCPTCRARKDGFATAGIQDPTKYAA